MKTVTIFAVTAAMLSGMALTAGTVAAAPVGPSAALSRSDAGITQVRMTRHERMMMMQRKRMMMHKRHMKRHMM